MKKFLTFLIKPFLRVLVIPILAVLSFILWAITALLYGESVSSYFLQSVHYSDHNYRTFLNRYIEWLEEFEANPKKIGNILSLVVAILLMFSPLILAIIIDNHKLCWLLLITIPFFIILAFFRGLALSEREYEETMERLHKESCTKEGNCPVHHSDIDDWDVIIDW